MNLWRKREKSLGQQATRLRHDFVVGPQRHSELFARPARLYYCVRCKWSFLVCGSKVAVLNEEESPQDEIPIVGEESLRRFNTFAEGACPALEAFVSAALAGAESPRMPSRSERDEPRGVAPIHVPARPRPPLRALARIRENLGR
jgi:hypothetical protein